MCSVHLSAPIPSEKKSVFHELHPSAEAGMILSTQQKRILVREPAASVHLSGARRDIDVEY